MTKTKGVTISKSNEATINEWLASVEGRRRAHCLDYDDIVSLVADVEERLAVLPKKFWPGVRADCLPFSVPNSYGRPAQGTGVIIERVNRRWVLVEVGTRNVWPTSYGHLPDTKRARISLPSTTDRDAVLQAFLQRHLLEIADAPDFEEEN